MQIKIGIEVHCQLNTKSKIFCGCSINGDDIPNSRTCPTCLGHAGSKPVLNKEALRQAVKVALALGCTINTKTFFSRKIYFYPDLTKNFQITQYEIPIANNGELNKIRIRRLHLEEDPGRLVHKENYCLVDYNRSGIPLIEVVTEPDFTSPAEVREFLKKLITTLEYLEVYSRTSEATLRADANISIDGGERVEVKNITGLKDIERALQYEIERGKKEKFVRETRGWDSEIGRTYTLRKKEVEEEYGYIFEPDLPKFELDKSFIEAIKKEIPELAHEKIKKYVEKYKLEQADAEAITGEFLLASMFENVAKEVDPVLAARWLRRELIRVVNYNKIDLHDIKVTDKHLIELLKLVETKKITQQTAQRLIEKLVEKPFDVKAYVEKEKLVAVSNEGELDKFCKEVIKENPQAVADYRKGESKALFFLSGKVMQKTKGTASPQVVNRLLERLLA